jgi:exonuclease SbcC
MSYHFTRLRVKNFGQHIDKEVFFKPGVNCIIGESESGKTTLIRALHLLLENQPRGGEKLYKADNAKGDVFIELEDSLGNVISRSKNVYTLNGSEYKAVGTGVPEPIRKIIGFKEINWQNQLEAHFMLFKTGNAAAETLNKTTGMEEQELILKEIKNRISECKSNVKRHKKNNEDLLQTIERLKNVPNYLESIKEIIKEKRSLEKTKDALVDLDHILIEHYKIVVAKKLYEMSEKHIIRMNEINKIYGEWLDSENYIQKLENLINKIEEKQRQIVNPKTINNCTVLLNDLIELDKQHEESIKVQAQLNNLIANIQYAQAQAFDTDNLITILEEEKQKKFKELGYCPLCERKINGGHKC